jgi:hypothetical protein
MIVSVHKRFDQMCAAGKEGQWYDWETKKPLHKLRAENDTRNKNVTREKTGRSSNDDESKSEILFVALTVLQVWLKFGPAAPGFYLFRLWRSITLTNQRKAKGIRLSKED